MTHEAGTVDSIDAESWLLYLDSVFLLPHPLHTHSRLPLLLLLRLRLPRLLDRYFNTSSPLILNGGAKMKVGM